MVPEAEVPCPACGAPVAVEADACPHCGEPISLFGQVLTRHTDSRRSPLWLEQVRGQARGVKHEEELASQKRWEALQETDRRRLETEAADELSQRRKDRLTLRWGLGLSLGLVLLFLVLALVVVSR